MALEGQRAFSLCSKEDIRWSIKGSKRCHFSIWTPSFREKADSYEKKLTNPKLDFRGRFLHPIQWLGGPVL